MNKLFKDEKNNFFKQEKPKKVNIRGICPKDSLKTAGNLALVAGGILIGTKLIGEISK